MVLQSKWIPQEPTARQLEFLARPEPEVFFGGAAGPGKSSALLMAALMFADVPGYSALLFRKTYTDLSLPGALMDRAAEWLMPTGAKWSERDKTWHFPSGATLTFGYLDGPKDRFRYQGSEVQFIGFDEATQIREEDYLYLFSRLRKHVGERVPLRARAASNPGGESHGFFGDRFVTPELPNPKRVFIPALLEDNPYLDRESYEQALAELPELEYRQLRRGEWVRDEGESIFKPHWFPRYDPDDARISNRTTARWCALDTANTVKETSAYSALVVGDLQPDYTMPVRYVARERLEFPELVDWTIEEVAPFYHDRKLRGLIIEDAASGTQLIQTLRTSGPAWLRPLIIGAKATKAKEERWKAASVWAKRQMTPLPHPSERAPWLYDFERELFLVPSATHLDQADAYSMLVNHVEKRHRVFSQRWQALSREPARELAEVGTA